MASKARTSPPPGLRAMSWVLGSRRRRTPATWMAWRTGTRAFPDRPDGRRPLRPCRPASPAVRRVGGRPSTSAPGASNDATKHHPSGLWVGGPSRTGPPRSAFADRGIGPAVATSPRPSRSAPLSVPQLPPRGSLRRVMQGEPGRPGHRAPSGPGRYPEVPDTCRDRRTWSTGGATAGASRGDLLGVEKPSPDPDRGCTRTVTTPRSGGTGQSDAKCPPSPPS